MVTLINEFSWLHIKATVCEMRQKKSVEYHNLPLIAFELWFIAYEQKSYLINLTYETK